MRIFKNISCYYIITAFVLMLLCMSRVQAAPVTFTMNGVVDLWADLDNEFGLDMVDNNTITVTGTFDDSILSAGTGTVT